MKHVILSREIGLILDPSSRAPWRRQHPGFSDEGEEAFHDLLEELVGTHDYYEAAMLLHRVDFRSGQTHLALSILTAAAEAAMRNTHVSTEEEKQDPNWVPDGMHYVVARL